MSLPPASTERAVGRTVGMCRIMARRARKLSRARETRIEEQLPTELSECAHLPIHRAAGNSPLSRDSYVAGRKGQQAPYENRQKQRWHLGRLTERDRSCHPADYT